MSSRLDENGHELLSSEPVAIPAGFKRPETLAEQVQRLVRTSISRQAEAAGQETFDEADDFDVDDEVDPHSPYETFFDPVLGKDLSPAEFKSNEAHVRRRYLRAQGEYFQSLDRLEAQERLVRRRKAPDAPTGGAGGGQPPASTSDAPKATGKV